MNSLSIVFNGARKYKGNYNDEVKPGCFRLIIDCTIINTTEKALELDGDLMFSLIDEDYFKLNPIVRFLADIKGDFDGMLGANRKNRGEIAFEVGKNQTAWELVFETEHNNYEQIFININNTDIRE